MIGCGCADVPDRGLPTGRRCSVRVTSMRQGTHGLPPDVCVMGFDTEEAFATQGLSIREAARVFGVDPRTIETLRALENLP